MATWQFANDHGGFNNFDPSSTGALEQSYNSNNGKGVIKTFLNGWTYEYDFDNMTQKNVKTGKVRKLNRIAPADPKANGAAGKRNRVKNDDASDDEEEGNKKSHKPEGKKSANSKSDSGKNKSGANKSAAASLGKVVIKGRGAVDSFSGKQEDCHVIEKGNVVYQCTLNQTNIANNNNKFYIAQALASDDGKQFFAWFRWGRIGETGQSSLTAAANEDAAIKLFKKKFSDKTSNNWDNVGADYSKFVKKDGLYQLMAIDLGNSTSDKLNQATSALDNAAAAAQQAQTNQPVEEPSKLPVAVQNLIKKISNKEEMTQAMKELEIDTNKMPLGMISKEQIKSALSHLKTIETELKKPKPSDNVLNNSTSAFYTLIPHDFGRRMPPIIRTEEMLQQKVDLLDVLSGLEVATKLLDNNAAGGAGGKNQPKTIPNRLDRTYASLNNKLTPLDENSEEYKRIVRYVQTTHGSTHRNYTLKIKNIFQTERSGEAARYKPFENYENRMMLYHGSRMQNHVGILSQGMRIAPPEAPVTGYMFGRGIYFASVSSKSANYCHASQQQPTGYLYLYEAALGKSKVFTQAEYMDKPKPGTQSTWAVGRYQAAKGTQEVDKDGVVWPVGPLTDTKTKSSLLYDEMVIYDVAQCKMRYMIELDFKF